MQKDREHTISRVTIWGAAVNLLLSVLKMIAGLLGKSSAMVADAVHSISDLASDFVILVMVRLSSKEKDRGHDYGHGKYETLATVVVALMLLAVGGKLMAEGVSKIRVVLSGGTLEVPGSIALWAAVISIVVKEILYQWTAATGKRTNSPAMIANAWHHRTDALSSVGSAIGIGCAMAFGGKWVVLDPVAGCLISIFIIVLSVRMAIPALKELTEASLPENEENRIMEIIQSVPGIDNAHDLRTRRMGPDIVVEAHIVVNPDLRVSEAHHITEIAEKALRKEFGESTHISLHVEPSVESV